MEVKKIVTDFFQINILNGNDYTFQIGHGNVIDREEYEADNDVWHSYDPWSKTECLLEHISTEFFSQGNTDDIEPLLESLVYQVEEYFTPESL